MGTGLVLGALIGLGAMGLTLTYGLLRFVNFAHGDVMTMGMFLAFTVVDRSGRGTGVGPFAFGWPLLLGAVLAAAGATALLLVMDRIAFRPLQGAHRGLPRLVLASLGLGIMLRAAVELGWGVEARRYAFGDGDTLSFIGLTIRADDVLIVGAVLLAAAAVHVLLHRTHVGRSLRAAAENPVLAELSGVNLEGTRRMAWVLAGAVSALAGVLVAMESQLRFDAGFGLLPSMLAAAVLGGLGSPWGALAGGLAVGVAQQLSTPWLQGGLEAAVPLAILLLTLLLRPRGLFGARA